MKALDEDTRARLLRQCDAGELHPPIKVMPLATLALERIPPEAKRAARALLRMKPAR
jgi:hypothetical protein